MPGLIMSRFRGLSGGSRALSLAPAAPQIASHTSVRSSKPMNRRGFLQCLASLPLVASVGIGASAPGVETAATHDVTFDGTFALYSDREAYVRDAGAAMARAMDAHIVEWATS